MQHDLEAATLAANVAVHSHLAKVYDSSEPHFRPENQDKVRHRLAGLAQAHGRTALLDIGCGTGFVLRLAVPLFDRLVGIDATPAMLERAAVAAPGARLHHGAAEALPLDDDSVDVATAYSVLDHLEDPVAVLREARRVLKPGGAFYADLIPHRLYWAHLSELGAAQDNGRLSPIVDRERRMVTENDQRLESEHGMSADLFRRAEPWKEKGGLTADDLRDFARRAGFRECRVELEWFLGQGKVMHEQSFDQARVVDAYLKEAAPLTDHLYKYLWTVMVK